MLRRKNLKLSTPADIRRSIVRIGNMILNGEVDPKRGKTVSSMLGHYDAGFTLRTYTHATRQKQEQAAEKIGNFMDKVL